MRRLVVVMSVAVLAGGLAMPALADDEAASYGGSGRFDRPFEGFAPESTVLGEGAPASVGLDPAPIDAVLAKLRGWLEPGAQFPVPLYGGEVALLAHDGVIVARDAAGWALRYADKAGTELPADQQVAMTDDTIFDLASVSKLFTSIIVLQEIEAGRIDLDEKVAHYIPEYAENGKAEITVKQLLTHTSGMQPFRALWREQPDAASRIHAVLISTLSRPPGTAYLYSDFNLITLGVMVERLNGSTLDKLVQERITGPLGMVDTGYNPDLSVAGRTATTEFETDPPRGMVRGSVHDENAWSLGGVAGHAGVFSTAADLAILCQTILNGGTYNGARILAPETVTQMITNYNAAFPGNDHGLGFEINQMWYMGGLAGPQTVGHTGFTGTSLVIDFQSRSFAVLLTNRVHPDRAWTSPPGGPNMINFPREDVGSALAQALAVRPKHGGSAWFSGIGDARTATLTASLRTHGSKPVKVSFDAFVDTEPDSDYLYLESSVDNGTTWTKVPFEAIGTGAPGQTDGSAAGDGHRSWWKVTATLSAAPKLQLRWRYTSDARYSGRGVYVDGIRVQQGGRLLLSSEFGGNDAFTAVGWTDRPR